MTNKSSLKVSVDLGKNRLTIVLTGSIAKKELESLYTEIRFGVADLKPGFAMINDLTGCKLGYLSGLGTFTKIREYLQFKGAGVIIRVIGKRSLIAEQLTRIVDRKTDYEVVYVSNREEADRVLTERGQSVA